MPNTLKIKLGADELEFSGEFTAADVVPVVKEFIRGRGPDPTQEEIDQLTDETKAANDAQEAVVAANTPN